MTGRFVEDSRHQMPGILHKSPRYGHKHPLGIGDPAVTDGGYSNDRVSRTVKRIREATQVVPAWCVSADRDLTVSESRPG